MTQGQLARMTRQESEIRLLKKMVSTQTDTIKMYKNIIVPMYQKQIKDLKVEK